MPCCKEKNIQINQEKVYDDEGIIHIYENLDDHQGKIIEGNIADDIRKPFNKMTDGINKFAKDTKDAFEKIPKMAQDLLKKDPLNKMTNSLEDFGKKAKAAFEEIPKRFRMFGNAFRKSFRGLGITIDGLFSGIKHGFDDIGFLFKYFGIFIQTYIDCGVHYIRNFTSCIFYYIADAIFKALYMPFTLTIWLVNNFAGEKIGKQLREVENTFWSYMWKVDEYMYSFAKFHILKWPRNIRDQCYNCKRLKVSAMKRVATTVKDDFEHGIKDEMTRGVDVMKQAGDDFLGVFT
jgi:hypothetical protein